MYLDGRVGEAVRVFGVGRERLRKVEMAELAGLRELQPGDPQRVAGIGVRGPRSAH